MYKRPVAVILTMLILISLLAGCGSPAPPTTPTPPPLADELIFYDWAEDSMETIFEAFTEEYGVKITYLTYESQEEAIENIRTGEVYDVVVLENQFIPSLLAEGLLAEIDYRNVPNFKNISASFRDLAYDPGNEHSIPYSWGTTGLVVRNDLLEEPVTSWADMWDPRYAGRVAGWAIPRYTLGAALKTLGYSINSEDPGELEAALERLLELRGKAIWLDDEMSSAPLLVSGEAVMALGWAYDVWTGQEENQAIGYVLPEEGTILWGDNFVIPANSPNKVTAELFLDFILRPEISAQIVNGNYYPMANEAANSHVDAEILNDTVVFPSNQDLENAEILLPLSSEGEELYAEIWKRFMAAGQ
jgi:spermidine/putrescine transport system substrate-binding protein